MFLVRKPKEPTEIVFDITDGMRLFALSNEQAFDESIEVRKRAVEVVERAVLRIRAFQRLCKHTYRCFEVLTSVLREGWGKVVVKVLESHCLHPLQNFLVLNGRQR